MKPLALLALFLLSLAAPLTVAADEPPELPPLLFIVTGQSNAGQRGTAAQLTAPEVPGAWYYAPQHTKQRTWLPLAPYGDDFGVEHSFARAMREATGRTILIVKIYSGGTSIIAWQPGERGRQWQRGMAAVGHARKPAMYPRTTALVSEAVAAWGGPVEVAGVVWVQAERDSKVFYGATRYEANLRRLIAALRADYGAVLPFVAMDSHTNMSRGGPVVHDAILRVVADTPGVTWVEVRDLPLIPGEVHFNSAGLITLGQRYAAAMAALRGEQ